MLDRELETPCYVIHKEELWQGIALLKSSLAEYWENSIVGYSFKTNALPWALMQMKKAGFYAEVVSEDEYELAELLGFEHFIYNGPVKGKESFLRALKRGAVVNLDAGRELDWLEESGLKEVTVGLRVNFDLEKMCPGETTPGEEGGRFGFSYETGELKKAMDRLHSMGVRLSGLHLHVSSKTRSIGIYRALAKMACRLKREYDLKLDYLDLGGGYFGGMDNRPKFPDYIKAIREELLEEFTPKETMLIVEPGTSLITPPIEYVTEVVDIKDTHAGRFVVVDGSRSDIDPLHAKSSYFHEFLYGGEQTCAESKAEKERQVLEKQVLCGYTCMENDRLFTVKGQKELRIGDRICFQKVGGYTMCLTPLFIRYFPAVYVKEGGTYRCVREHWRPEDYIRKNVYEEKA